MLNDMQVFNLIRNISPVSFEKFGTAISYVDIYNILKLYGLNQDIVNAILEKLNESGLIELCCDKEFDEDLIIAVKIKQY